MCYDVEGLAAAKLHRRHLRPSSGYLLVAAAQHMMLSNTVFHMLDQIV
jgi:hypothetical protein